jgi:5-methylcytosine-specific restriction endonuclease McrA
MLLKACNRCGNLIPYGSPYCKECTPIVEAEREARLSEYRRVSNKRYNKTRDPKYVRFYNGVDWRTLSARYAQDKGYRCERCKAMATQVHHKKAIQTPEGWELRLDYNNLELLCTSCHNEEHDRFKKKTKHIRGRPKGV